MSDLTRPGALPLRPLTTGELLDSAFAVLRLRPKRLVVLGAILAAAEQVVLFPLRSLADQDISLLPATGHLREFAWLVVVGFGTEAIAIGVLGAVAAASGGRALLGRFAPQAAPAKPVAIGVSVAVIGLVAAFAASPYLPVLDALQAAGFLVAFMIVAIVWPLPYGLLGLAPAAVVIERRGAGSALLRSIRLARRDTLRAALIRVLGYLSWLLIRIAIMGATLGLLALAYGNLSSSATDRIAVAVAALIVNALAYPALACLDVVLFLEARMRTEGLDIALRWALRRGVAPSLETSGG